MTRKLLVGAIAVGALAVTAGTAVALSGQQDPTNTSSATTTTSSSPFSTSSSPSSTSGSSTSGSPTSPTSSTESSPTSTGTNSPSSTVPVDPVISRDEAIRIAQERVGGGDVTEVENELEHGRPEWKIELHVNGVEHDVRVDARTGDVTRVDSDDDRDDDDHDGRDDRDDRDDDNSGKGSGDDQYDDD